MNFKDLMKEKIGVVESEIQKVMPSEEEYPGVIHKSMNYSVNAGGKRLRPILAISAAEAVSGDYKGVLKVASALEMIHTYSLIHDDLPALDNDDLRRGVPTNHKVFGEAIAVLAGDALLTYAFQVLAEETSEAETFEKMKAYSKASLEISQAVGTKGMIGGQVVDIESENTDAGYEILKYIHKHKTGDLIKTSVRSGAIIAGADEVQLDALTDYAEKIGLAFQITDDILDLEGDEELIGKPIGSDEKNHKLTYPSIFGLDESKEMAKKVIDEAVSSLAIFDEKADFLRALAEYILMRKK